MSSFVEIAGKKYENVSHAASLSGYSRDYIGRLAREGKILASQVGRQWFVFVPSLLKYAELSVEEQNIRKKELSSQRKQEREETSGLKIKKLTHIKSETKNIFGRKVAAVAVLALGVGLGTTLNVVSLSDFSPKNQIASAPEVGSFTQAEKEFPIATGKVVESTELQAIDFSKESMTISTLDAEGKGVLLLPSNGNKYLTVQQVKELFSDPIKVVKDNKGNSFVVKTNSSGVEEQLPFAVVPVTNSETP